MQNTLAALIQRVGAGVEGARDALFSAAYDERRKRARSRLRDGGRNTSPETTALVHESHLRCFGGYSETELGEALGLTERSVRRD